MEGDSFWFGSATEKPGFFLTAALGANCTMRFSPPILAFTTRTTGQVAPNSAYLEIYDTDGNIIECETIPYITGVNTYAYVGFSSTTPIHTIQISTILPPSAGSAANMDIIEWFRCEQNFFFNGTACLDIDECLENPCGANTYCNNTEGSYTCTCNEGYTNNGTACVDIDECAVNSTCSHYASCNNTESSFTCTCNKGYTGDGIGVDGCQLIQQPMGNAPISNEPVVIPPQVVPVTSPQLSPRSNISSAITITANIFIIATVLCVFM